MMSRSVVSFYVSACRQSVHFGTQTGKRVTVGSSGQQGAHSTAVRRWRGGMVLVFNVLRAVPK
jgi:hypothetical protein